MILTSSFDLASMHSLPNQVSIARKRPEVVDSQSWPGL